ncbi:cation efflux family-domain-containing protein [Papiliotrema laurentii]|jgi:zinc transporter 1|uniref:Cation efflux family-domain-containing protein n=1 Tax=Papiliotrema laurentii TaxID=5418 RepID=A0AAD9CWX9_PAPLA|nr:cation efflux family-domain-containing protein [Papiliotrema laurentii]KAK1920616.1 cation efflux family-domain-containing protein [Papiliotrema laurentii]
MTSLHSRSNRILHFSLERRIHFVILVASAFLLLELVVGFITRSLALVADAFHILSDIIGYVVAVVAVKYAGRTSKNGQYTYGYRRAETLGGFFNGGK